MNVFSYVLAEGDIPDAPQKYAGKFVVDDNVGESIHIHYRNVRLEFSVADFIRFAEECETATEVLDDGNR
ncbi:hypothetical protein CV102_10370 [Natronococcus pandeyae]|uniref:Uncharacterized protein n=1 Tax=Natronococcus pandeyae TaxID=2055836 RepID=A0A8J8TQV6_9EURY|nr:hypothetical protein [Natronococcus pandeyae]TYL38903.1 hypothetical protein CV102_10370 [Natronococcus pandeyae]